MPRPFPPLSITVTCLFLTLLALSTCGTTWESQQAAAAITFPVSSNSFEGANFIIASVDEGFISEEYKAQYLWVISTEESRFGAVGRIAIINGSSLNSSTYNKLNNPTAVWIHSLTSLAADSKQAFDFTISIDPGTVYVYKGGSATVNVFIEYVGETPQRVALFISGMPQGVSCSLGVESGYPPIQTTLTITATPVAQAGTYVLTIVAVSENITKVEKLSLIILEKAWYEQLWMLLTAIIIAAVIAAAVFILIKLRQ